MLRRRYWCWSSTAPQSDEFPRLSHLPRPPLPPCGAVLQPYGPLRYGNHYLNIRGWWASLPAIQRGDAYLRDLCNDRVAGLGRGWLAAPYRPLGGLKMPAESLQRSDRHGTFRRSRRFVLAPWRPASLLRRGVGHPVWRPARAADASAHQALQTDNRLFDLFPLRL